MPVRPAQGAEQTSPTLALAQTGSKRVGVYDSRSVALACGRSTQFNQVAQKLCAEYEKAKTAGDTKRLAELNKEGEGRQDRMHRQVFGDAPIEDILETIKPDLAAIQRQAGVQDIVARGRQDRTVETVDVTTQIVALFHPTSQTLQGIEELKTHPPLPADQFPLND